MSVMYKKPLKCLTEKPEPPGKPEVLDRDRTFIEMKWEPPRNDGGAPITGYEVERKEPKTNRWVKLTKAPITVSSSLLALALALQLRCSKHLFIIYDK